MPVGKRWGLELQFLDTIFASFFGAPVELSVPGPCFTTFCAFLVPATSAGTFISHHSPTFRMELRMLQSWPSPAAGFETHEVSCRPTYEVDAASADLQEGGSKGRDTRPAPPQRAPRAHGIDHR